MNEDYSMFLREFRMITAYLEIKEIAQRMRVTTTTVYSWFNGQTRMNAESIIRAIWAFGIDMEVLFHAKWRTLS